MKKPRSPVALPCLILLAGSRLSAAEAPVWPPPTDVPPDPAIVAGQLDNGLRYAVRANNEPRDRVSVRLLVQAGSLDETESERGLAHFLEHMAFNGTSKFPGETLVEWFQRQGMSFGGDSNAGTGYETTTYMLELPHGDPELLAEGFGVLRGFADGMLIEEEHVDRERGIILAEMRARDSVRYRTHLAELDFVLPDTLPAERSPIGVRETIEAATQERLAAFYRKWYRPANMAVVVVGEVDPEQTASLIGEAFGSLTGAGEPAERADRGLIEPITQPLAATHREVEAPAVTVSIQVIAPFEPRPDSVAERLRNLPLDVANNMVRQRLSRLAREEDAPFTGASIRAYELFDFSRGAAIELYGPPDRWRDTLAVADKELRRALQYGFDPAELEESQASIINGLEEAVRAASTRQSRRLADGIVGAIDKERVFTTPETNLEIVKPAVEGLTVDDCVQALREAWSVSAPRIFVAGPIDESVTADVALNVFQESAAVAVDPPEDITTTPFAYTEFGPPGEIVTREHVEDLDITLVRLANGVRLNLKRTDFRANSIGFRARLGGGQLALPKDRPELAQVGGALMNLGGFGAHDVDELRRILAGRSASVRFGVDDDAFVLSGGATPKDLELGFQLMYASITDPGLRANALAQIHRGMRQSYEALPHTPGGVARMEVSPLLASGDPRFGVPPLQDVLAVEPADVAETFLPRLASGALEVAIVGDIDIEKTIALAARTLGTLPAREPKPDFAAKRRVSYPAEPPTAEFPVDTEILKALVLVYWPTDDASDIHRTRRLAVLSSVVSDRLRKEIREELGAAYSPSARSSPHDTFTGYGLFSVGVEVDPPEAERVQEAILDLIDEIRANGVTEDELERAKEPIMTSIRQSVRENGYWLRSVLSRAQEKPEMLDWARSREEDFKSITTADLDALAARYLDNARAAKFIIRPPATGAGAEPAAD